MKIKVAFMYCCRLLERAGLKRKGGRLADIDSVPASSSRSVLKDRFTAAYANEGMVSNAINSALKREQAMLSIPDSKHVGADPGNILEIIDDNDEIREFIRESFADTFSIVEACDGRSGLEKAISFKPQVIITDVSMPFMNGIELCRKLKDDERTSHIPVILLTGRSSDSDILDGLKSGADDYITKPFNTEILKTKVINLLDFKRRLKKSLFRDLEIESWNSRFSLKSDPFLQQAFLVVEKNLSNPLFCVDDFAREMSVSRAQLYRKIQLCSGETAREFIRNIRLNKAAELLAGSNYNVSEIAFEVGFNSLAYFTKSFSDYFGVVPSKYIATKKSSNGISNSF